METLETPTIEEKLNGMDWRDFAKTYWRKKPVLYRNCFQNFITKDIMLNVLKKYGEDYNNNIKREITFYNKDRLAFKGSLTSKRYSNGMEDLLPSRSSNSLDDYLNELQAKNGFDQFCIYINNAHIHDEIILTVRDVLIKVFEYIPYTASWINTDFFIGNYSKTTFGAHKDPIDNMMFMLFGKKRMLLWSDSVWKEVLGNPNDDSFISLDYERFRGSAIECNLFPGDFLYWPSEYWHVGENDGLSASFNIDYQVNYDSVLEDQVTKELFRNVFKRIGKQAFTQHGKVNILSDSTPPFQSRLPEYYRQVKDSLVKEIAESNLELEMNALWIKKVTSHGLFSKLANRKDKLDLVRALKVDMRYPIRYSIVSPNILIGHSGHVFIISSRHDFFQNLIDVLNLGEPFFISDLYTSQAETEIDQCAIRDLVIKLYEIRGIDYCDRA